MLRMQVRASTALNEDSNPALGSFSPCAKFLPKGGTSLKHYLKQLKTSLPGLLAWFMALAPASAIALDIKAWEVATNPETKERYIPVELWSGAEWDGKRELIRRKGTGSLFLIKERLHQLQLQFSPAYPMIIVVPLRSWVGYLF